MQRTKGAVEVNFFYGPGDKLGESYDLQSVESHITHYYSLPQSLMLLDYYLARNFSILNKIHL